MERLALFLAAAISSACCAASEPVASALSCVSTDSCGCSILVEGGSCPNGGAHFFHELADGSSLHFSASQGPVTATSTRPSSTVFSPGPGESWTETYGYSGGNVEIHYTPGKSTCTKSQGEQCEYFDVRARVLLSSPQGKQVYSGVGACGC
jgi:hypothetical protein